MHVRRTIVHGRLVLDLMPDLAVFDVHLAAVFLLSLFRKDTVSVRLYVMSSLYNVHCTMYIPLMCNVYYTCYRPVVFNWCIVDYRVCHEFEMVYHVDAVNPGQKQYFPAPRYPFNGTSSQP